MIRVLIVDDHPVVREGIGAVLEREADIEVVGAAETLADARRVAATRRPDVILLDLKLPDAKGVEEGVGAFAREGRAVVVFTAYDGDDDVFRAIRAGARGYLLKGSPAADIVQAIRQVHGGESYLSPRIAAKLVTGVASPRARAGLLSARERGVLRLVAAGLSNRQIAQALSISERTVKFHVTSLFNKLGAENRAQAVAVAAARGLLPGD
jgi:DNA-binding NarL/FixJ family response regulator